MSNKAVIVKLQRPIVSNGSMYDVMSYIVDENGEQDSNPAIDSFNEEEIKELFGDHYKIYYLGHYTKGKKLHLIKPIWEEEWV